MNRQQIKMLCRELRKNMTPSERILWEVIRKRQLSQYRFLRQFAIITESINGRLKFCVADFYCHQLKLLVEVDGPIHEFRKNEDYNRDLVVKNLGLHTLRIKNEELESKDEVLEKMLRFIDRIKNPSLPSLEKGRS